MACTFSGRYPIRRAREASQSGHDNKAVSWVNANSDMITVRKRLYESANSYQGVFTRIRPDIERVSILVNPLVGNLTVDTNKPWVGKINSSDGTFKIVETNSSILPLRFFEGNFFTIFIHGKAFADEGKTRINVSFELGWQATLAFLFVYLFPMILIAKFVSQDDWDSLKGLTFWFLVFNVIPTLLLMAQLGRLESKIADLLGTE
jgi:hypothetical protein